MKLVCIMYHATHKIKGGRETVETYITLPMCSDSAKDLIEHGEESPTYLTFVHDILDNLSSLQGLDYIGFCSAKLADKELPMRYRVAWCDFKGRECEIKCRTLQDAIDEMRYLDSSPTRGPVKVQEIQ